jgi:glyoxylase-like metal-dependent hydrolase (beta-lactamase superfamily II)
MKLKIKNFFDPATYTLTYIVFDELSRDAIVIDPVMDYDPEASKVSFHSIEKVSHYVDENHLKVSYILESHAHADHLSGSQPLKQKFPGAQIAIGSRIREVQKLFKGIFNMPEEFRIDGSQFDQLLEDGQIITAGTLKIKTIFTPGHTPACTSYLIEDALFTGDSLFMPDHGTGRCDFPSGSAADLYESIFNRLYKLPDNTRVFVGHDYLTGRKEVLFESTIGEQKKTNVQLRSETSKEEFITARNKRDKVLSAPRLLLPSVQINIDAGNLPKPEENGARYLKIPIRMPS